MLHNLVKHTEFMPQQWVDQSFSHRKAFHNIFKTNKHYQGDKKIQSQLVLCK